MTTTPQPPSAPDALEFVEQPDPGDHITMATDVDQPFDGDPADLALDPAAAELPDLSDQAWPAPPEPEWGQDLEGLGGLGPAIPEFVRPNPEALAILIGYIKTGKSVEPATCLRETRQYFNVFAKYAGAKDSLAGAIGLGVARRVPMTEDGVKQIPRGAIVYWRRIIGGVVVGWGHIAPSFGGGYCGSTDWPTGRYGRVNILTLARAWAYTEIWWAPVVNDVRVWKRPRPEKPTPLIDRYLASDDDKDRRRILERLAADGDGDNVAQVKRAAQRILNGLDDAERAARLRARGRLRRQGGRQALRELAAD